MSNLNREKPDLNITKHPTHDIITITKTFSTNLYHKYKADGYFKEDEIQEIEYQLKIT